MGQRLVIAINCDYHKDNGDKVSDAIAESRIKGYVSSYDGSNDITIVNCYYHWSGYTTSSLNTAITIMEAMDSDTRKCTFDTKNSDVLDNMMEAVHVLWRTGAGFTEEGRETAIAWLESIKETVNGEPRLEAFINEIRDAPIQTDHSDGIIELSNTGMNDSFIRGENNCLIDMTAMTMYNDTFSDVTDTLGDFETEMMEDATVLTVAPDDDMSLQEAKTLLAEVWNGYDDTEFYRYGESYYSILA